MGQSCRFVAWLIVIVWATPALPCAAQQSNAPLLFDREMTAAAGATIVTTVAEAVIRAEDAFVPVRLFEERGVRRRVANMAYRFSRFVLLDVPQQSLFVVANHEVFGHGARLTELFDGSIDYHLDAPPPYGSGGGATFFELDRPPSRAETLAFTVGGMEASGVAASLMSTAAVRRLSMDARHAIGYLGFELDTFFYVQDTDDEGEEEGHDVSDFLLTYNQAVPPLAGNLTAATLRREAFAALANPLVAFAGVGIIRYLWGGDTEFRVPTLSIAGIHYLPLVRYRLTPFGTEFVLTNEFAGASNAATIELRIGRAPGATPWGVTIRQHDLGEWRMWSFAGAIHLWWQPPALPGNAVRQDLKFGGAVVGRVERPLAPVWFSERLMSLVIEAGFKGAGYAPGERLDRGAVLRAGVALPLSR